MSRLHYVLLFIFSLCAVSNAIAAPTSGLYGELYFSSDIDTEPSGPLADKVILAFKEADFKSLIKHLHPVSYQGMNNITFYNIDFTKQQFAQFVFRSTASKNDGSYRLALPAGKYILAIGDNMDKTLPIYGTADPSHNFTGTGGFTFQTPKGHFVKENFYGGLGGWQSNP